MKNFSKFFRVKIISWLLWSHGHFWLLFLNKNLKNAVEINLWPFRSHAYYPISIQIVSLPKWVKYCWVKFGLKLIKKFFSITFLPGPRSWYSFVAADQPLRIFARKGLFRFLGLVEPSPIKCAVRPLCCGFLSFGAFFFDSFKWTPFSKRIIFLPWFQKFLR